MSTCNIPFQYKKKLTRDFLHTKMSAAMVFFKGLGNVFEIAVVTSH